MMHPRHLVAGAVCGFGAIACGSSGSSGPVAPQGSGAVSGTINGQPVTVTDVMGAVGTTNAPGVVSPYAAVVFSNTTGTCALAQRTKVETAPSGTNVLVLEVVVPPGNSVTAGTYMVGTTGLAQYQHNQPGDDAGFSGSGTVTFDTVSASSLTGSFDVELAQSLDAGGSAHLTGTFSAPICPGALAPF
jgi:hypothetical protein